MKRIVFTIASVGLAAAAFPGIAHAAPVSSDCTTVNATITKTDNGHGTPSEWADLHLNRSTKVCGDAQSGYTVTITDNGTLLTRAGAGTPNGTGGQILNQVPGTVQGTYALTVTGGTLTPQSGDTTLSSTAYVRSLFTDGATVKGGAYTWTYVTCCGEKWVDSSDNNDGQGDQAGNITGKTCQKTPSPTPKPTSTKTSTPSPTPTSSTPSGEAPPAQPVSGQPHFTG